MDGIEPQGIDFARHLAAEGRFVSAIKHIELSNPGLSRGEAKSIVASFHLGDRPQQPENFELPIRAL